MARYSEELIAQLKANADIVSVLQTFVPLRQRGKSWLGICPFHDDRSPSMYVTPSMGIFKCFACGAGGDVFKFVMDHEKIDFNSAVEMVAQESGFSLPTLKAENKAEMEDRAIVLALNELAHEYFCEQIKHAKTAQDYIARRGVSAEICERFGIGYAPDNWDSLVSLAASRGFSPKQCVLAGLANEKDAGGVVDKFRGRLMISIQSLTNKIVGFGGRIMVDGTNAPKYMNSPETPLYHKSDILFGLNHARQSIEKSGEVIVVEGYFDLISLYQAGIQNVVAVSGTALTEQHARLLARYAKRIFLVFDGDGPGRKAARKSLETLMPMGMEIRILVLPDEDDPDELVREKGAQAFRDLLQTRARDFLDHLSAELPQRTPEERTVFHSEIRRLIAAIRDPLLKQEYLNLATQRYPVSRQLMASMPTLSRPPKIKLPAPTDENEMPPPEAIILSPIESRFLNLMTRNPFLWKALHAWFDPDIFESRTLVELLDSGLAIYEEDGAFDLAKLSLRLPNTSLDLIQRLPEETWNAETAQKEFLATLVQITIFRLGRARQSLQARTPETSEQLRIVTELRLECNRFVKQLEVVKIKLAGEADSLQSASLLWAGLREGLPKFFSKMINA